MVVYVASGQLTAALSSDVVGHAEGYLQQYDMVDFLRNDPRYSVGEAVEEVEWQLSPNGRDFQVVAVATRALAPGELDELSKWVSGQNSDGLGESFEQQAYCEEVGASFDWASNTYPFVLQD